MTGSGMHATLDPRLLTLLLEALNDAVIVLDASARVILFNAGAVQMFGHSAESMLGQPLDQLLPEDSRRRHAEHYRAFLAGEEPSRGMAQSSQVLARRACGEIFPVAATIVRARSEHGHVGAAILRDISDQQRTETELRRLSCTDALTGLLNRRSLLDGVHQAIASARDDGTPLSILFMDMDHFKSINDQHGHLEGDRVLMCMADCVRNVIRLGDLAGRLGGEEFAVVLPRTSLASAGAVAERIRHRLESYPGSSSTQATVSVGIAEWWPGDTADDLLRRADQALYQAKADGRNRVGVADS